MSQIKKLKEIAEAIRGVERRASEFTIAAKDFASEIRKLDPTLTGHDGRFENGYYGIRAAKCASTYLWARVMKQDKFAYHTRNIFSQVVGRTPYVRFGEYARIDCSTFVGLCLRGIPYEKSPYAVHKGVDETWTPAAELSAMYGTEGWEFRELDAQRAGVFHDLGIAGCSSVRYAADLGRYFHKYGRVLYDQAVDGVITDQSGIGLQPGDLVFWSTTTNEDVKARFKSISHVAIVAERTDYYYHVTGTEGKVDQIVVWYEQFAETDTAHPNSAMVLAVRPDYRPRRGKEETPVGVNLLGFPWVYSRLESTGKNGLTISMVDRNTIKLSGTATENTTLGLTYTTLSPGRYVLTGIEDSTGVDFTLQVRNGDGTDFATKVRYPAGADSTNRFVLTEEKTVAVRLYVGSGKSLGQTLVVPALMREKEEN